MGSPTITLADDPTIPDDAVLWRRIKGTQWVLDRLRAIRRPSSSLFGDHPNGSPMSAALAAELAGPEALLESYEGFGVVAFTAGFARHQCGQAIVRAPLPGQPWHVHVVGKKTGPRKKLFYENSVTIRTPAPPYPP